MYGLHRKELPIIMDLVEPEEIEEPEIEDFEANGAFVSLEEPAFPWKSQ